jgi:chromosome segregation ATPase
MIRCCCWVPVVFPTGALIANDLGVQPMQAGFKAFKERTSIGPLGDFTAVVGPNGCGKSIIGEALAWVLGGSKRMLRAKTLASLVNTDHSITGANMATVRVRKTSTSGRTIMCP